MADNRGGRGEQRGCQGSKGPRKKEKNYETKIRKSKDIRKELSLETKESKFIQQELTIYSSPGATSLHLGRLYLIL